MFGQHHVKEQLTAYTHGELSVAESERVAAHLGACARCRAEFEEIAHGIRLMESLTLQAAPASLWENIEAALAAQTAAASERPAERAAHRAAPREKRARRGRLPGTMSLAWFAGGRPALAASLLLLFVFGVGGASWFYLRTPRASWEVARLQGAPSIDAARIGSTGRLGIGEWLETDADSRAQIRVANIGQVEIDPGTRIRLVETRPTEHRLELA
ncbi:MAG TPA: zf-HC2 domain-containing protein, partial [Pyrinomonadaceae bacterium]|nr:zf-HC2 domain-containing protein [Pyrinomonadaceae bacterium]